MDLQRQGADSLRGGLMQMRGQRLVPFSIAWFCLACRLSALADDRADVHSYARPDQIRVNHVALDLTVNFGERRLEGSATLRIVRQPECPTGTPLILDDRGLSIDSVELIKPDASSEPLKYRFGTSKPVLGRPLLVDVPDHAQVVRVHYRTTDNATALQWLDPAGTAGGKQPFLFTQSQAVHARSWIPLQDSPAIRVTYEATIHVPDGLTALMSADGNQVRQPGQTEFRFRMPHPVAPYLIALAVGDLEFLPIGKRTGVWAEPSVVGAAAAEFADTEKMVETAERRYGPYRWGRYDILVLPPSFPYGGMENPELTFATPTVIAGDRSLVSLVAHELAHSWSGNLVTNATWSDFWLNEGFTTYVEYRIIEDLYGVERADMERTLGLKGLRKELAAFAPRDQLLHARLEGRDPDESVNRVAYDKGALFLATLDHAFGRDTFDPFLRDYFNHFAFQSITTADFLKYLREHLLTKNPEAAARIDVHAWTEEPGLPSGAFEPTSSRFARVDAAAADWLAGRAAASQLDTHEWTTHEWLHFLGLLPQKLSNDQLAELDRAFGLTERGNAEVAQQWLLIAVRNNYAPAQNRIERFLTSIGRRKFVIPLYAELCKTPDGLERARRIFAQARPRYHPITTESVERLLNDPRR